MSVKKSLIKKQLNFKEVEMKESSGDFILSGYASAYGNVDLAGDRMMQGCFKDSIMDNPNVPILANHSIFEQIGVNDKCAENTRGLKVEGIICASQVQKAKEYAYLIKKTLDVGGSFGLSVGFYIVEADWNDENPMIFEISKAKLIEYSITPFPCNPKANISSVEAEKSLKSELGGDIYKKFIDNIDSVTLDRHLIASEILNSIKVEEIIEKIKKLYEHKSHKDSEYLHDIKNAFKMK